MLESLFTSLGLSILCSRIKERRDRLLWNQVESISDSEASKIGSFLIAESNLCLVQLDGSHWRSAPHTAALSSNDLTLQLLGYGPQHSRKLWQELWQYTPPGALAFPPLLSRRALFLPPSPHSWHLSLLSSGVQREPQKAFLWIQTTVDYPSFQETEGHETLQA